MTSETAGWCDPDLLEWSPIVQVIGPDAMIIRSGGGPLVAGALARIAKLEHVPLSPAAARMMRAATAITRSSGRDLQAGSGHADVPRATARAASPTWVRTAEAAAILGISSRQCRRYMDDGLLGPTRRVAGNREVRRDEVAAMAAERRASAS